MIIKNGTEVLKMSKHDGYDPNDRVGANDSTDELVSDSGNVVDSQSDANTKDDDLQSEILKLVAETVTLSDEEVQKVTLESKLSEDLKLDSLSNVDIIIALEEKYDIEIPDEDAEKIMTFGDVFNYVKNAIDKKS